jgi:L-fuconolactonase
VIVDTHCHADDRWYEPVDTLLFNMDRCGVDRAVLVQILGSTDSRSMLAAARNHPDRFQVIAAIDPTRPDAIAALDRAVQDGVAGLRLRSRWEGDDEQAMALWRAVEAAGLVVSVVGPAASFVDGRLARIAEACPRLPLVLEHLGGLARPDVGNRASMLEPLCTLARHPNIHLKLPGLGQIAPRAPRMDSAEAQVMALDLASVDVAGLLARILDAFGPHRLMWGSDFPPVAAREGYGHALGWTRALIAQHWPLAVDPLFGCNAAGLFPF